MKPICVSALLLLLCHSFLSPAFAQSSPPTFRLRFEYEVVIGKDEDLGLDYLFTNPVSVARGRAGSLLVADRVAMNIREYGPDGRYVRAYGTRGAGPGEFRQIADIFVHLDSSRLFVVDGLNRRVSAFDLREGAFVESWRFDDYYGNPRAAAISSDMFAFIQTPRTSGPSRSTPLPALFIRSLPEVESRKLSTFNPSGFQADDFVRAQLKMNPGSLLALPDGRLYFAPRLYHGQIFAQSAGSQSEQKTVLHGAIGSTTLYQEVGEPSNGHFPDAGDTPKDEGEMRYYRFPCQSLALFEYRPGLVGHVAFCEFRGPKRQTTVEFFDSGGNVRAVGVLDEWTDDLDNNTGVSIGDISFPLIYGVEFANTPIAFVGRVILPPELERLLDAK